MTKKTGKKKTVASKPKDPFMAEDGLYAALARAQTEMNDLDADGTNPHFGSKYTTLGKILGSIRPILGKHGLAITMELMPYYDNISVVEEFPDGGKKTTSKREVNGHTLCCAITYGKTEQQVESDMYIPKVPSIQQFGSFMTYVRRYLVQSLCAVHTDMDDDGEAVERGSGAVRDKLTKVR